MGRKVWHPSGELIDDPWEHGATYRFKDDPNIEVTYTEEEGWYARDLRDAQRVSEIYPTAEKLVAALRSGGAWLEPPG
jgi:hypothetical protein